MSCPSLCLLITAAVAQLRLAFSHEMATGTQESIPIVYRGRIYIVHPGSVIQAIDGTNGKLIWEYKQAGLQPVAKNGLYVFALPDKKQ